MDYLRYLNIPTLYIEVVRVLFGLSFLFILNIIYRLDISSTLPNYSILNDFSKGIILVAICYFISRCFLIIANFWLDLISFILLKNNRLEEVKRKWKRLISGINGYSITLPRSDDMDLEVDELMQESGYLRSERERDYHYNHFCRLALGATFFLAPIVFVAKGHGLPVSAVAILVITSLTIQDYLSYLKFNDFRGRVAQYIGKSGQHKGISRRAKS